MFNEWLSGGYNESLKNVQHSPFSFSGRKVGKEISLAIKMHRLISGIGQPLARMIEISHYDFGAL